MLNDPHERDLIRALVLLYRAWAALDRETQGDLRKDIDEFLTAIDPEPDRPHGGAERCRLRRLP